MGEFREAGHLCISERSLGSKDLAHARLERRIEWTVSLAAKSRSWMDELNSLKIMCSWLSRSHGKVSFRLTQLLTDHSCFDCHFHRINCASLPICGVLGSDLEEEDCTYHASHCTVFEGDLETLVRWIRTCGPNDLVHRMLNSTAPWWTVIRFKVARRARDHGIGGASPG